MVASAAGRDEHERSAAEAARRLSLLREVSRSFYLSVRFLPDAMREPVALGYLLARYSDTLADSPGMGPPERLAALGVFGRLASAEAPDPEDLARLDEAASRFGAGLGHDGERRLLKSGRELIAWLGGLEPPLQEAVRRVVATILRGQTWDVERFGGEGGDLRAAPDAAALDRYTYEVAGCVGEFWTRVGYASLGERFARAEDRAMLMESGRRLGEALQLVNILRDLHEDLPAGRCYLPADELRAVGWSGEGTPSGETVAPVFERWLARCEEHLEAAEAYPRLLRDFRVRFATRLPAILARRTARRLREAGARRVLRERVKVPKRELWIALAEAALG